MIERRKMIGDSQLSSIENRIDTAIRLQKPKLLADMCAFRGANPEAVFHDFTCWYGNPDNPLEMYNNDNIFLVPEFHFSRNKSPEDEMNESILILNATRKLWIDCWDESEPIPAEEQKPLFDAFRTVEMLLLSLESMHPSILMNQVLAVNLSTANFILKDVCVYLF